MRGEVFAGCANIKPLGILLEGGEKSVEPAFLIAVFEGSGPPAKFFHIVAHRGDAVGMRGSRFVEVGHNLVDSIPRD